MRTKNRPLLLARALRSVLAQTFTDFELIVVNDVGGDLAEVERTIAAVEELADGRISLIDNTTSFGREGAMNVGIEAASSELVVIHDDDDTWHPEFLERTVAHLDANPGDGAVDARTAVVYERIEGDEIVEERRDVLAADKHSVTLAEIMRGNYVTTNALLFRRSVYDEAGPVDGRLPVLGDWEFLIRFLKKAPIGFVSGGEPGEDLPLAFWHQRPQSTGDAGNSVVVESDRHREFAVRVRDDLLRRSLAGGDRGGELMAVLERLDAIERRIDAAASAVVEHADVKALAAAESLEVARVTIEQRVGEVRAAQTGLHAEVAEVRRLAEGLEAGPAAGRRPAAPRVAETASASTANREPVAEEPAARKPVAILRPRTEPIVLPTPRDRAHTDTRTPGRAMKRVVFYLFFDPEGKVDDYVLYKLRNLREHAEHIFVVSNGPIGDEGLARLETVADTVWQRENVGFDVWGYKEAQERFGWDRLAEYDELILMNYTFFGPIFPFSELFDRLDASDVDFWGVTEHEEVDPHPHHGTGVMPAHIQSHWIAVRGDMIRSKEYREYWTGMPMITSYYDSIDRHEARFTKHFANLGFRYEVAFPAGDYPSQHPVFDDIALMLGDRLPILKRRIFFHDPLYLDKKAIIGRDVMDIVEASGYPPELIWRNVVRSAKPRALNTNFTMMEILPEADQGLDRARLPRIVAIAHLYYEDLVDEIVDHVDTLPGDVDLVITTTDERKRGVILEAARARGYDGRVDVRIVESNRGRDVSAFLVGCADVLRDERYDIVVKIHGKKSVQDGWNAGQWFKRHLLENLLHSEGYTANVIKLFQDDETLGMVFPPVVHMGYPTMGHAWFLNKEPAQKLAKRLGIRVPFDDSTPLSPYGSMFIARREALRPLVDGGFSWSDFPEEGAYKDGTLAHVLERLFSYGVLSEGYTVRTVMNAKLAAISHTFLEYKLQAVARFLPGQALEQVPYLARNRAVMGPIEAAKRYVTDVSPRAASVLRPAYTGLRGLYRKLRRGR